MKDLRTIFFSLMIADDRLFIFLNLFKNIGERASGFPVCGGLLCSYLASYDSESGDFGEPPDLGLIKIEKGAAGLKLCYAEPSFYLSEMECSEMKRRFDRLAASCSGRICDELVTKQRK